jgi:hypothetical protein
MGHLIKTYSKIKFTILSVWAGKGEGVEVRNTFHHTTLQILPKV